MTAAGDPRSASELRAIWIPTLGDDPAGAGWRERSPHVTCKPEGTTELDLPPTVRDATLSGVGTLGGTTLGGATLSGRPTQGGATQGGPTLSGRPTLAGAEAAAPPAAGGPGFELIQEIGRGGMGVVFKARQRSLAREIAVKLIRPEHHSPASRGQFVAEALVNGLLDHPNIVPVHELGRGADGEVFLAMKLVGGTSWKDLLHPSTPAQRALAEACDLDRHLEILEAVGNAVAFAHSRGIVHRDLKPENVMVGAFGEVLVMDWGIAVDVRDRPEADARARHKSTVRAPAGTPSYMAPELAEGRGADIGPWTDTYLLGAILCEILTGQPPHRGETLLAVLMAASASQPPSFPPSVSPGLAAICTRALARRPEDRFRTVAELQAALRDHRRHRESERIAQAAAIALGRAQAGGSTDEAARARRYGDFAESIAGYRQALVLWRENAAARAGERTARIAYARAALAAGDVALAQAQIPQPADVGAGDDAEFRALAGEIAQVHAARARARALAKRMRVGLIALTAAVVLGLSIGLVLLAKEQIRNARLMGPQRQLEARMAAVAHDRAARAALFGAPDPDAELLASGAGGAALPAALPAELAMALRAPDGARMLAWSTESGRAIVVLQSDKFAVLDPGNVGPPYEHSTERPVVAAAFSGDGRYAATVENGGKTLVWSLENGEQNAGELALPATPARVALDAEGQLLAVESAGTVTVWDWRSQRVVGTPLTIAGTAVRIAFDRQTLAVVGSDERGPFVVRADPRTGAIASRRQLAELD